MEEEEETGRTLLIKKSIVLKTFFIRIMQHRKVFLCFHQASDMMDAILEGYPKSKKEFLVGKPSKDLLFQALRALTLFFYRMKLEWRLMKTVRWFFQIPEQKDGL